MVAVSSPANPDPRSSVSDQGFDSLDKPNRLAQYLWSEFESKFADLFISEIEACKFGIIDVLRTSDLHPPTNQSVTKTPGIQSNTIQWISSVKELNIALQQESTEKTSKMGIIYRKNSWSRLSITSEMFLEIYSTISVTPHFLKFVIGFQRKWSSNDEDFVGCYSTFSTNSKETSQMKHPLDENAEQGISSFELCYNIRHFERHRRDLADPWSCRQSAIYQKYEFRTENSYWLLINPPIRYAETLEKSDVLIASHSMDPHLEYLSVGIACWRDYLNYMSEKLKILNSQIAIKKPLRDHDVDFSSKQKLHNIRHKLDHAQSIMIQNLDTLKRIGEHEEMIGATCNTSTVDRIKFKAELKNIATELNSYYHTTKKILRWCDHIMMMYDDVLKFNGQELIHNNGVKLAQIAEADSAETRVMAYIAGQTYQDSRAVRIMTVVALLYLPANLVLSFFSTTLVWFVGEDQTETTAKSGFSLRVHPEIWLAVLMIVVLSACTFLASLWWDRKGPKNKVYRLGSVI